MARGTLIFCQNKKIKNDIEKYNLATSCASSLERSKLKIYRQCPLSFRTGCSFDNTTVHQRGQTDRQIEN